MRQRLLARSHEAQGRRQKAPAALRRAGGCNPRTAKKPATRRLCIKLRFLNVAYEPIARAGAWRPCRGLRAAPGAAATPDT